MSQLKLYLFGPPRLVQGDRTVAISLRKDLALLVYLTVTGQPHSRDALAALLWPESDQSGGRGQLRRALYRLNRVLPANMLTATSNTVALERQTDLWLDLEIYQAHVRACLPREHPVSELSEACLARLREAVALYTDDFLAGFTLPDSAAFDEWQFFQTESLRGSLAAVLEQLVHVYQGRRELDLAIGYARRWLALDPLHEPVHSHLMRLYAWSGQQAAALRQYEECVRLLDEELGVPPEEATTALYEAIRTKRLSSPPRRQPAVHWDEPAPAVVSVPQPELAHSIGPSQPAAFVGRERECGHLARCIQEIGSRRGHLVLVEGEPGIGKSRLVAEAVSLARSQGVTTLVAKCYDAERGMPYQVVIDLVEQVLSAWPAHRFDHLPPTTLADVALLVPRVAEIFPNLPTPPAALSEALQARLFHALHQLLLVPASEGGLVLGVDDIHWADHATLQFLHYLARRSVEEPILLVCTYRSESTVIDEQFAAYVPALLREPHASHLVLERLSLEEAQTLVASLPTAGPQAAALGQWLYHETDGHPFFLVSILQSLQEQGVLKDPNGAGWQVDAHRLQVAQSEPVLPDDLRESVRDRLRRVSADARAVLNVVAVFGRHFEFPTLQAIVGEQQTALADMVEDLLARQLLREIEGGRYYDFNHDKIREVVYRDMSAMRRRLLHRRVAEVLESLDSSRVATLAEHFEKGEVWEKAVRYLARAADRARGLFAMREALRFYDRALALTTQYSGIVKAAFIADLHHRRGEARTQAGEFEAAVTDLQIALDAAIQGDDYPLARDLHLKLGMAFRRADDLEQARTHLYAALVASRASGDERRRADTLFHLGTTVWSQGDNHQAFAYHQEAVEICRRLELTDLVAVQALHGLAEAYLLAGRPAESIDLFAQSLQLARQIRDRSYEAENLQMMGMAMAGIYGIADYERAEAVLLEALAIGQETYLEWHQVVTLGLLGQTYGLMGDYQRGLEYVTQGIQLAEAIGTNRLNSFNLGVRGMLWQELNLPDKAQVDHTSAVELARKVGAGFWLPRLRADLVIDRLRLGDLNVGEELHEVLSDALARKLDIHAIRCLEGLAELALARGRSQQALEYADELQALAEHGGMREMVAQSHRWRGEALLALQ